MNIKKTIFIFLFFTSFNLFSLQNLNELSFYVTAESGLSIRENPSLESKKIGRLEYKSKVKIKKVIQEKFETIYDGGLKISSNWILIENPIDHNLESYVFGGFLRQKDFKENKVIDTSNWIDFELQNHNISLKLPNDWIKLTAQENEYYQWDENTRLIIHEDGMDPTQVIIKEKNSSIIELEKEVALQKCFKTIEEKIIDKIKILKCTYFFENGCSQILYLHKINDNKTNIVEVSGACNSHPNGYDETKISVAESVKFSINEKAPEHIALKFINSYVENCNKDKNGLNIIKWSNSNEFSTEDFKNKLNEFYKSEYIDFNPIFDAQDYPADGFELNEIDSISNYLTIRGKKNWKGFEITMKIKKVNNQWFVDGCGVINIPKEKQSIR